MKRSTVDYAWWDDTYDFAQNHDFEFIESNFRDSTFQNLDLNLVIISDIDNNLLYCKIRDNMTASLQADICGEIVSNSLNWNLTGESPAVSGLLLVNGQPMMIAATPILTSEIAGPAVGRLMFGIYLDSQEVAALKKMSNVDFSINVLGSLQAVEPLLLNSKSPLLVENNEFNISAYGLLNDLNSNPAFILQVNRPRIAYQQGAWVETISIAFSIVIIAIFSASIFFVLEHKIIRPMNKLAASVGDIPFQSKRVSKGKFESDEIVILSDAVSNTVNSKMDAMLDVSSMVAHDLRNPLAGIRNANYVLKKNYSKVLGEKGNAMLSTIDDCVLYSNKIVNDLLDYSSKIKLDRVRVEVSELVKNSLGMFVSPEGVEVSLDILEGASIFVDPEKVERVFCNLIKNAFDAMPGGGRLVVSARRAGGFVVVKFVDSGVGMSEETLRRLWQPFFTTKAKGMGIGLPTCKRIIEAHGGRLEVKSVLNKGTVFEVYLPVAG
ncbi:hypothetical protein GX563_12555 [Candidatus Bathyarchaeota archaeon]|nr:hypothetical protein [Candidatus Bathyarchaeota archaeon]